MQISKHVLGTWNVSNKIPRFLQDFMGNIFLFLKGNEKKVLIVYTLKLLWNLGRLLNTDKYFGVSKNISPFQKKRLFF